MKLMFLGAEMADGLVGSLVVRRAPSREPHRALYDEDRSEHVLLLAEWTRGFALQRLLQERSPRPDSLLLNGRGSGHVSLQFKMAHQYLHSSLFTARSTSCSVCCHSREALPVPFGSRWSNISLRYQSFHRETYVKGHRGRWKSD
jgi:hypothetical protein